jgi:acetylornithine deacetylase
MNINLQLFLDILNIDSTSGSERELSQFLEKRLAEPIGGRCPGVQSWELEDGSRNLLFLWGTPKVVFCTHIDTVPPYIPPRVEGERIWGRGSCDAKGQLIALYTACCKLVEEGLDGFGLLLLSGEETGSWGAKAFAKEPFKAPYLIIGEPTDNKMISASKGTKSFKITFEGKAFHSGYPQFGYSAVDAFVDFVEALRRIKFEKDPVLGDTTWNIGRLISDNPQNVLSPELSCRLYFRTTFVTDDFVSKLIPSLAAGATVPTDGETAVLISANSVASTPPSGKNAIPVSATCQKPSSSAAQTPATSNDKNPASLTEKASISASCPTQIKPLKWQKALKVESIGGDAPANYFTLPGFKTMPAAFGSDAPHLSNFEHRAICGPGSIRFAHRDDEHIDLPELLKAVEQYVAMFKSLK